MTKCFFRIALVLILIIILACISGGCSKSKDLPNIIFISIDTLRADHVSCYGYEKKTTPMIDMLAQKGVRFTKAFAPAPWTLPSHASMFTGLYPSKHKAIDERVAVEKDIAMLTEKLQAAGYETGGFVTHYYLSKDYGFDRGFDKFVMKIDEKAETITKLAATWIRDNRKKPFFAFIHYFDPHTPYYPPAEFRTKYFPKDLIEIKGDTRDVLSIIHSKYPEKREKTLRALLALYDGEIDYVDSSISELYKKLQLFKLDRNTLIVITSDHGEEFYEHGLMEHGFTLYQEQLHVPLIFYCPEKIAMGKTSDVPVSLVDLFPTLLEYAGIPLPEKLDGNSILPLLKKTAGPIGDSWEQRALHAQTTRQGPDRMCIIKNDNKYIYSPEFRLSDRSFGPEFFNLKKDPAETVNLIASEADLAQKYQKIMTDSEMYIPKKVWHVLFSGTKNETRYNGRISTIGRIISAYKENVIYDTDVENKLVAREFPWQKRDVAIRFVAFGRDGKNGFSVITDPPEAKLNFFLYVDNEEHPEKIGIGSNSNHPKQIPFALENDVKKESDAPVDGGFLVWSSTEYVNSNILLRFEVGDQVQPSAEMRERLRTLGYLTGN